MLAEAILESIRSPRTKQPGPIDEIRQHGDPRLPRRGLGVFQWNAGGWFGSLLGCTVWLGEETLRPLHAGRHVTLWVLAIFPVLMLQFRFVERAARARLRRNRQQG